MISSYEKVLIITLLILILVGIFSAQKRFIIRTVLVSVLLTWGFLEIFGIFIPEVNYNINFGFGTQKFKNIRNLEIVGYPIELVFTSKAGFISNYPISVAARIHNVKGIDATNYFKKEYDAFTIIWTESEKYPIEYGDISPTPLSGAVDIDFNSLSGKSSLIFKLFKLPGSHQFKIIYHRIGEAQNSQFTPQKGDGTIQDIYISPSEVITQIKSNNVTRGLSFFVLSMTLFNLQFPSAC
jgi:hypothetical protein